MSEPTVLAVPIELHDAELDVVFGARSVYGVRLGGGSGGTAVNAKIITGTATHTVLFAQGGGDSGAYAGVIDGIPTAQSASGKPVQPPSM